MFKEARKAAILAYIQSKEYATTKELHEHFQVSVMTINRLLRELHCDKKIHKFHGGVSIAPIPQITAHPHSKKTVAHNEQYFEEKRNRNLQQKLRIGRYAALNFLEPEQTYFFEAGSTVHEMIPFIDDDSITIITNGIHTVRTALKTMPSLNVICIGGSVRYRSMSVVGDLALRFLDDFHARVFFVSGQAIAPIGIMDPDPLESSIKRKMIEHSSRVVVLADDSKMNRVSAELVTSMKNIHDIVTNKPPARAMLTAFKKHNVIVHVTDA